MMPKKRILFCLFIVITTCGAAFAQNTGMIQGSVRDSDGEIPLVGASVMIDGTILGTSTDKEGRFTINNVPPGTHNLVITYVGYDESVRQAVVNSRAVVRVDVFLYSSNITVDEVVVLAKANRESEGALLFEQMESLVVVHSLGAVEMSRKGTGDAQAAVAQIAGVSKQEGAKNVFVRGLGDRYNTTLLNGFPVPSEDPEYKNIALKFFSSDIIQNIGVSKVFSAGNNGDVGGAVIDIHSKELQGSHELQAGIGVGAGINTGAMGADFLRQDGVNYLGFSNNERPADGEFDFANKLDPRSVSLPLNLNYGFAGGKRFDLDWGPLSMFLVASHSQGFSYTEEAVRKIISNGAIIQDQTGEKSSIDINELVLASIDFSPRMTHSLTYNFMLLHNNEQYVGRYYGFHAETYQNADQSMGYLWRQQSNDNLLMTHQLNSKFVLSDRMELSAGVAYNTIKGLEPDRRENHLSREQNGLYFFVGSNRQKRSFSDLDNNDLNVRASLRYRLAQSLDIDRSNITVGYKGRFVEDNFKAVEYNMSAYPGHFDIDNLRLDDLYNNSNLALGQFTLNRGDENHYRVLRNIHTAYAELSHQLTDRLAANMGLQADIIDLGIDYYVDARGSGESNTNKSYLLPSLNLRYDLTDRSSLRLGLSKSYILPQAKEIAPYQYVNIGFASEGNPDLKPSDCYNVDLKWDFYPERSELVSVGLFYKHIIDPMGRVDKGGSAHLLTYDNLSDLATVAGLEVEVRKNIFERDGASRSNKLTAGFNASYIYSNLDLAIDNTARRKTELEGASPVIANADLSYSLTSGNRSLTASLVGNYTGDRINTLGTLGYYDIIEQGIVTLSAVASYKFNDHWSLKLKAGNLLDPSYRLTQRWGDGSHKTILSEYKKGVDLSLGLSFSL